MNTVLKEKLLEADLPVEFLRDYGSSFYHVVDVLGGMAARGEAQNIVHVAHLLRLLVGTAAAVAEEVRKKKEADDWRPRFVT